MNSTTSTFQHRALWRKALATITLAFMGLGALPVVSHAATTDGLSWSVAPGGKEDRTNFTFDLEAGETHKDSFVVTNLGTKEISLAVYAADGITSSTGALDLKSAEEPSEYIGAWVQVKDPVITLGSGEQSKVGFTLQVPENTEPGDYVGGLISSYADTSSGSTVMVDRRLATRMNVHVGGEGKLSLEIKDLAISTGLAWNPFAPVDATVSYTVLNTGTVRARGPQTISTSGPFGIAGTTSEEPGAELIPGGSAERTIVVPGVWPLFNLTGSVKIHSEGIDATPGTEVYATTKTLAVPWGQLCLLILLVGGAIILGVRRGRFEDWEEPEDAEDVQSLR